MQLSLLSVPALISPQVREISTEGARNNDLLHGARVYGFFFAGKVLEIDDFSLPIVPEVAMPRCVAGEWNNGIMR